MAADNCNVVLRPAANPQVIQQAPSEIFNIVADPADPIENIAAPDWALPQGIGRLSLNDLGVVYWLATLVRTSYDTTNHRFIRAMSAAFPADTHTIFAPNPTNGLTPGYGIIDAPEGLIVAVSGTTNLNQWLAQTILGRLVPTAFGPQPGSDPAKAMSVYRDAAVTVAAALNTWGAAKPVLLTGHSMGGAVASVVAYKLKRDNPDRVVKLVTFASPKAGFRLADRVRTDREHYLRLANDPDFVPALPPNLGLANVPVPPTLAGPATEWSQYQPLGQLYLLQHNGTLQAAADPNPLDRLALALISVATSQPIATGFSHPLNVFVQRLQPLFPGNPGTFGVQWRNPADLVALNANMSTAGL